MMSIALVSTLLCAAPTDARALFEAASRFFVTARYEEAARYMERAYAEAPSPTLAFSLAQAQRMQYFVDRDATRLDRAIELYRLYLRELPSGPRRRDAVEILAEIEPLATRREPVAAAPVVVAPVERTELLVTTAVAGATLTVDGGAPLILPAAVEVAPGPHTLLVQHALHHDSTQTVVAIAARSVPVEIELRPRAARYVFSSELEGEVHVDGAAVGRTGAPVELTPGPHRVDVAIRGHELITARLVAEPAEARTIELAPVPTFQRSMVVLGIGATAIAAVATGALTGWAIAEDGQASDLYAARSGRFLLPAEADAYDASVGASRDVRSAAIVTGGVALALALATVGAYWLDLPDVTP